MSEEGQRDEVSEAEREAAIAEAKAREAEARARQAEAEAREQAVRRASALGYHMIKVA